LIERPGHTAQKNNKFTERSVACPRNQSLRISVHSCVASFLGLAEIAPLTGGCEPRKFDLSGAAACRRVKVLWARSLWHSGR
jgi:hypothetical protein